MMRNAILILTLWAGVAGAANVIVVTNNVFDLDPVRDAETVTAGQQTRLNTFITDGTDPIDLSDAANVLVLYDTRDNWEVASLRPSPRSVPTNGALFWLISSLPAGEYLLLGDASYADTNLNFRHIEILLTVDPAPPTVSIGATSVTNLFTGETIITNNIDVAGVVVTNNITLDNSVNTFVTNIVTQFDGINILPITVEDDTLSGEWTVAFTTNSAVQEFTQVGSITNFVFSYDTNKVNYAEIVLFANGDSIAWPTNNITWQPDSPPTASNQWQSVIFRAHRGNVQGAYIETYD